MLLLLPIGRKTSLGLFPWITFSLIILSTIIFFLTWPAEKRFMTERASVEESAELGRKLANILLSSDSGFSETHSSTIKDWINNNELPSKEIEQIFSEVQNQKLHIGQKSRYKWELLYPRYEAFRKSAKQNGGRSSSFRKYGFSSLNKLFPNIITYQFLHAGFLHLFFNMLFLWMAGCNLEERWGPALFLALYLFGGAAAAIVQYAVTTPHIDTMIGASGAVASIMGAFLIRHAYAKIKVLYLFFLFISVRYGVFESPAWLLMPLWFMQQLFMGLLSVKGNSHVGYWAHVGGFIFGVCGALLIRFSGIAARWEAKAERTGTAVTDKLGKAHAALAYGEKGSAETLFTEISKTDPSDTRSRQALLTIYAENNDKQMLLKTASELIRLAYEGGNDVLAARTIDKVTDIIKDTPVPDSSVFLFGFYCEKYDRWADAVMFYRKIIEAPQQSPFLAKALFSSAKILSGKLNRPGEAKTYFDKLLLPPFDVEWTDIVKDYLKVN